MTSNRTPGSDRPTTPAIGRAAESAACAYLEQRGYRVLERNVRLQSGELDVIAELGRTLVFVEVRARRPGQWGGAADSVGTRKQRRLRQVAEEYLAVRNVTDRDCRIDVVTIDVLPDGRLGRIDLIESAIE